MLLDYKKKQQKQGSLQVFTEKKPQCFFSSTSSALMQEPDRVLTGTTVKGPRAGRYFQVTLSSTEQCPQAPQMLTPQKH